MGKEEEALNLLVIEVLSVRKFQWDFCVGFEFDHGKERIMKMMMVMMVPD